MYIILCTIHIIIDIYIYIYIYIDISRGGEHAGVQVAQLLQSLHIGV